MKIRHFSSQLWLPRPIEEVFTFFSDALNLEAITPPWLQFRVVGASPDRISEGTEIAYRLKIRGIPVGWASRITAWDPPHLFVDEQLHGPYHLWIHEHRFAPVAGGTLCADNVRYVPLGGALFDRLFVANDIKTIFEFRSRRLRELFPPPPAAPLHSSP